MNLIPQQVEIYIAFRQGLGVEMVSAASAMRQFARYADHVGHGGGITVDIAIKWARSGSNHAEGYEIKRYEMARQVHEFACALEGVHPTLPAGLLGKSGNRITPYILTDEEVSLLIFAAKNSYAQCDQMKPLAYGVILGLLASTGMRPGEALGLRDEDFSEADGTIHIFNTKNKRDRVIPLDDSVVNALAGYRRRRDDLRSAKPCERLFVVNGYKPVYIHNLEHAFCEFRHVLLNRGELWNRRPPRIYDLRHTFAVKAILNLHESGADVNAMLPMLATYMGHKHIGDTYWYLTGTPELLEVASCAFERIVRKGGDSL